MIEIAIHGRDRRAVEVLTYAAMNEEKFCQAFVSNNWSFCRIDTKPIRVRSLECRPDIAIFDEENNLLDFDCEGMVFVNSSSEDIWFTDLPVTAVDASGYLLEVLYPKFDGTNIPSSFHVRRYEDMEYVRELITRPFVNTAMLGAVAALEIVSIESVREAIKAVWGNACEDIECLTHSARMVYEEIARCIEIPAVCRAAKVYV